MKNRIRDVRKYYDLSQEQFGERINISKPSVSAYERGEREPTERAIADICREFSIDENWLRTGAGEMRIKSDGERAEELSMKYNLSVLEKRIMEIFVRMPTQYKAGAAAFVEEVLRDLGIDANDAATDAPIDSDEYLQRHEAVQLPQKDKKADA